MKINPDLANDPDELRQRAEEAGQKRNQILLALHNVTLEMGAELELPVLLKSIMTHAESLLEADRGGGIYLYETSENVIKLAYGTGINQGRDGITIPIDKGVAGHVVRTLQPLVVDDYTHWEERINIIIPDPPSTVMGVPLLLNGQVIGALLLIANSHLRQFNEQDVQLAEMFAAQAAIGIRNALLYQQAQQEIFERQQAEKALHESERRLTEAQRIGKIGDWEWIPAEDKIIWSAEMYAIFGIDPEETRLTVERTLQAFHPEDRPIIAEATRKVLAEQKPQPIECRIIKPDGSIGYVHGRGEVVLDSNGKAVKMVGVYQDITERKQAEEKLANSTAQLRALTAYMQTAIEVERTYIAREIHDEFGQSLTALKMDLNWLVKRLPEGDEKVDRIRGMDMLVDESIALMRRIATELRPNLLDDLGLNAAMEWQANEFSRRSGIPIKIKLPELDLGLEPGLSTNLFRIFQETLTNVARHAQATRVNASLRRKGQNVILAIRDNGHGISEDKIKDIKSLGLLGLRERAAQWGGEATIRGEAGKGTSVTIRIPLPVPDGNVFKP